MRRRLIGVLTAVALIAVPMALSLPRSEASTTKIVGIASNPTADGYWLVGDDGGVFTYGNTGFHGSLGNTRLAKPVVGITATPSGNGYWLVAADGGVFTFGDAQYFGSTGNQRLNSRVVGITATPSGNGYWLVAADGGVFTFGDAQYFGSMGGTRLNAPVVGIARTHSGNGYWLAASDAGLFSFGDANFAGAGGAANDVVGLAISTSGSAYWMATRTGTTKAFGGTLEANSTPIVIDPIPGAVVPAGIPPSRGLVWSDEFSSLDLTTPTHQGSWRPNDFWQSISRGYRDFAGTSWNLNPNETPQDNPFTVQNGVLTITAKPTPTSLNGLIASSMSAQGQPGAVPAWSGGMLVTNSQLRSFKYGYLEIRAAFPNHGAGMFPGMWLFSSAGSADPLGKGGAEIDLLEIFGDPTGRNWNTTTHYKDNSGSSVRPDVSVATTNTDTTQWHTYALDWQPTYLRFYLDGVQVAELTGENASWFNTTMSLRLNYAIDAPWFPAGNRTTSQQGGPLNMNIDYVRLYSAKP